MTSFESRNSRPGLQKKPEDDHGQSSTFKPSWRFLFVFTSRKHILPLFLGILFAILASLLKPASAIVFGRLFSVFTRYGSGELDAGEAARQVSLWSITLTGVGGATWLLQGLFLSQWMIFGELQARSVRELMFESLLAKPMEWYDLRDEGISTLSSRIQTQTRELQISVSQPLGVLILETSATIAAITVGFISSWKLTLAILVVFPIVGLSLLLATRKLSSATESQKHHLTRASKSAGTAFRAIVTVKSFNGQNQELWQYFSAITDAAKEYIFQARANALQFGILKFFMVAIFVHGFWFGLFLVRRGLDAGNVVTTFYACLSAVQAVEVVLPQWLVLSKGISAGETLRRILEEVQKEQVEQRKPDGLKPTVLSGDIEIKNVSFAYPRNPEKLILNGASFFFPAGETTYVIGRSGSGKSTLGNLLLKYYQKYSGKIFLDGHNIQAIDTQWIRDRITLVQQDSILFDDTILKNIVLNGGVSSSDQEAWEAAKVADLKETLLGLSDGLYTSVGQNGTALSGGQQQRVAIARAIYRDSPILILDEATSALDRRSQEKVESLLQQWREDKTTVIITHNVDRIPRDGYVYVIDGGIVVQEGYCKDLMEDCKGPFASFLSVPDINVDASEHEEGESVTFAIDDDANPERTELHSRSSFLSSIGGYDSPYLRASDFVGIPGSRLSRAVIGATQSQEYFTEAARAGPDTEIVKQAFQDSQKGEGIQMKIASPQINYAAEKVDVVRIVQVPNQSQHRKENGSKNQENLQQKPPKDSITSFRQIFETIWPVLALKERLMFVLGGFLYFLIGALMPTFAYFFARLLSVFYSSQGQAQEAMKYSLILIGIAITDGLVTFLAHYLVELVGQCWVNSLRVEGFKRALAQPKSWFDQEENFPNRLIEIMDRNAEEMRNLIGRFVGPVFTAVWMVLISTAWALTISWKLTMVTLAAVPVIYASTRIFDGASAKWEDKCNVRATAIAHTFNETFTKIRLVRAFNLELHFSEKHSTENSYTFKIGRRRAVVSGVFFGLTDSLSFFLAALIFYYGAKLFLSKELSVDKVLQVIQILMLGVGNAASTFIFIPQINSSRTAATGVLRLAQLPLDSHESRGDHRLSKALPISMNNINFNYPSRPNARVLSTINLTFRSGVHTALVGPSGSGKSTIASLLLGIYSTKPSSSGNITFNQVPIATCCISSLRALISVVPQEPHLFPASILANILYGLPEDHPFATMPDAARAAEEAGIHEFISSLDQGYNTLIGEGGMGLSGGQAQRIAIARALVRRPSVLILDEATSALDSISANAIRKTIADFLEGGARSGNDRCVITICHGVEMMRIADEVIMIEAGRIVERGSYEQLKEMGGQFHALIKGSR